MCLDKLSPAWFTILVELYFPGFDRYAYVYLFIRCSRLKQNVFYLFVYLFLYFMLFVCCFFWFYLSFKYLGNRNKCWAKGHSKCSRVKGTFALGQGLQDWERVHLFCLCIFWRLIHLIEFATVTRFRNWFSSIS